MGVKGMGALSKSEDICGKGFQENKGLRRLRRTKARKTRKMWTQKRGKCGWLALMLLALVGNGPNPVSESTVSSTELSEFFGAHWVPGSKLSEFLSAYYLCASTNSPSFSQNSPSLPQNSVRLSEFSSPETVFPKQYSARFLFRWPPISADFQEGRADTP